MSSFFVDTGWVTFTITGEDISRVSLYFPDTLDFFFDTKKIVLTWGEECRGTLINNEERVV